MYTLTNHHLIQTLIFFTNEFCNKFDNKNLPFMKSNKSACVVGNAICNSIFKFHCLFVYKTMFICMG